MRVAVAFLILSLIAAALPADIRALTKWDLWSSGVKLRGANIYQRRVYPKLDGNYLGPGPVGPPYTQDDFNRLAAMGANYVNISCPGLFREKPPYKPDPAMQNNLDRLIGMIRNADMFAVISFRTGPGRSEFTFFYDEAGTWFDRSYLNDRVWKEKSAQDAWCAMWKYTAARYRNNPVVVGYDLMVEPNSNAVWLDLWDPEQFYRQYSGTLYDWNPFFLRIIQAIRSVDANTPVLVGGMDYSALSWMPYMKPTTDSRTVYTAHQYEPFEYTTQTSPLKIAYPGTMDLDYDGHPDAFNRIWLNNFLSIINRFKQQSHAPVASNEYGVMRWEPGAARFLSDEMILFEQRGVNNALWVWSGSWPLIVSFDDFDFLHGPNPNNHKNVASSQLITAIRSYWRRNTVRPSTVVFTDLTGPAAPLCCANANAPPPPHKLRGAPALPMPHTRKR
jgi:hypothetical protein